MLTPDAVVPLALEPGAVVTDDAVWVQLRAEQAIQRIDAKTNALGTPIKLNHSPCGQLAHAFGSLWVPVCAGELAGGPVSETNGLVRADPKQGNASAAMPLPIATPRAGLAVVAGSLWTIADRKGVVSRIDPMTNAPVAEAFVASMAHSIAAADDAVWVTSENGDLLTRINAHTNVVLETIKVGPRPGPVAIGEGAIWTLNRGDGSVSRVDAKSHKVAATVAVGEAIVTGDLAVGEGAVWISAVGAPLIRVDPRTNRVAQRFAGSGGGAVMVGHGSVWMAAGPKLTWRLDPKLVAAMRP